MSITHFGTRHHAGNVRHARAARHYAEQAADKKDLAANDVNKVLGESKNEVASMFWMGLELAATWLAGIVVILVMVVAAAFLVGFFWELVLPALELGKSAFSYLRGVL